MIDRADLQALPRTERVDAGRLEALFASTATSYKYLLLKALVETLDRGEEGSETGRISVADLRLEMLLLAWHPTQFFKLNFGSRDMADPALRAISQSLLRGLDPKTSPEQLREAFFENKGAISRLIGSTSLNVTYYVVFRLLTPWFEDFLQGKPDAVKNRMIWKLSQEMFDDRIPLYRVEGDRSPEAIRVHPDWMAYLMENMCIVRGWLDMHWLWYLHRRNPNVPSLSSKLWAPPAQRVAMTSQRNFWQPAVREGFRCIYTGEQVPPNRFALDHFLPWSWVGHDQLWNLVPVSQSVNSSKGDRLPAKRLVDDLASAHARLLGIHLQRRRPPRDKLEDYLSGLNVTIEREVDPAAIRQSYRNTVWPQLQLASDRGFGKWHSWAQAK